MSYKFEWWHFIVALAVIALLAKYIQPQVVLNSNKQGILITCENSGGGLLYYTSTCEDCLGGSKNRGPTWCLYSVEDSDAGNPNYCIVWGFTFEEDCYGGIGNGGTGGCSDTDATTQYPYGENIFQRGRATDKEGDISPYDFCYGNRVTEFSCSPPDSAPRFIASRDIDCPSGYVCSGGACEVSSQECIGDTTICTNDGTGLKTCSNGNWVTQSCATGQMCLAMPNNPGYYWCANCGSDFDCGVNQKCSQGICKNIPPPPSTCPLPSFALFDNIGDWIISIDYGNLDEGVCAPENCAYFDPHGTFAIYKAVPCCSGLKETDSITQSITVFGITIGNAEYGRCEVDTSIDICSKIDFLREVEGVEGFSCIASGMVIFVGLMILLQIVTGSKR